MIDLKPCPFCGATNVDAHVVHPKVFVICYTCRARGPWSYLDQQRAEMLWNARPESKGPCHEN